MRFPAFRRGHSARHLRRNSREPAQVLWRARGGRGYCPLRRFRNGNADDCELRGSLDDDHSGCGVESPAGEGTALFELRVRWTWLFSSVRALYGWNIRSPAVSPTDAAMDPLPRAAACGMWRTQLVDD